MGLDFIIKDKELEITFSGDFLLFNDNNTIAKLFDNINKSNIKSISFNTNKLLKWDSSLIVIIYKIKKLIINKNIEFNDTNLPDNVKRLIKLAFSSDRKITTSQNTKKMDFLEKVGDFVLKKYTSFRKGFTFFMQSLKSLLNFFTGQAIMRKVDFLFAFENAGYKALPIVSLISFMIGLILAFVGTVQLKLFGAQIYVASLVAIGMVRIMGPAMAGIIMAGRTGASYAATIGTMQVNEEINALKTMGIPVMDFLTLPRLLSMTIIMPFLSMFADIMGIFGGASVGTLMLGIPFGEYWKLSMNALDLKNFLIGVFHGYVYGWIIALCGCYYGINCGHDADSVGKATTQAVVSSIVWIVIATGIITFFCEMWGL